MRISVIDSIEMVNFYDFLYILDYPGMADPVKRSKFNSGLDHFRFRGYFGGRLLADLAVDENFTQRNILMLAGRLF